MPKTVDDVLTEFEKKHGLKIGLPEKVTGITTGNLAIDWQTDVEGGGLPVGRIVELYGYESSGKTTTALQTAAKLQQRIFEEKTGQSIIYLDFEHALDVKYAQSLGLYLDAPSFVPLSWDEPVATAEFAAVGATALLEAVRRRRPEARVYQASSSEIFGEPRETPQTESTPLSPLTPYGVAKAYAHFIVGSFRVRYGLHASSGILYNHESPRRPLDFLPRKVAAGAAAIATPAAEINPFEDPSVVEIRARQDRIDADIAHRL
jgi:hypothetical protein